MKLGSSRGMDTKRPRGSERSKPCHKLQLTRRSQPPYPWPPEQAQSGVSKPYRTTTLAGDRATAGSDNFGGHRQLALVIALDQRLDQADRRLRLDGELGQRQRVLGETGPSEARPRVEELCPDAVVEADAARDVHHVGVETLAEISDLVDERHLHRQEHVGGVFDHLRTAPRSVDHLAAGALDRLVNIPHDRAGALVVDSNDHTIGLLEVLDRRALAEKFRIGYDSEAVARQAFLRNALDF